MVKDVVYVNTHMYRYNGIKYYWAIKKNEIMPSAAVWMDLEMITLGIWSQRKTIYHLCVPSLLFRWPAHSLLRAFAPPTPSALEAPVSSLHLSYSSERAALPDRYPLPPPPCTSSPCILLLCPCYSVLSTAEGIFISFSVCHRKARFVSTRPVFR